MFKMKVLETTLEWVFRNGTLTHKIIANQIKTMNSTGVLLGP